jgi:ATP-dependent DNA helicase MPH1
MKLQPDLLSIKHWIYPLNNERRDYQYNIVKHCLFENTLVALPTGLGKTFIAGVVMLNCTHTTSFCHVYLTPQPDYTWFPQGKVIFVAPTKPLVAQQVVASHKVCGIPGNDAVEMTGEIPAPTRERHVSLLKTAYR